MSKFWIIATDVYKKNVKSLSFLIMILAPFLLVGIVYLAGSLASGFSGDTTIGLVSGNQALVKELTKNKTEDFSFKAVSSERKGPRTIKRREKLMLIYFWTLQIIRFLVSFTLNAL